MTFQEIMDFHPGNQAVYEEIKESLHRFQLLPFVGAGLTASFYGSWSAALRALGKNIANNTDRDELSNQLNRYDYLGAAQLLEAKRSKHNLLRDMVRYFSRDKLTAESKALQREALYLLPPLFSCPILTTNFDEGIEEVYFRWQENRFRVLNPASEGLREQARRLMNTPCVFKLHGTVDGNLMDYDRLVFTEKQYDRYYGADGEARAALTEFANGRILFFLGCSLETDRTVDLLWELSGMGTIHYAIVHREGKDPDQRLRELGDMGISAILYPDGQHTSVRIILEQLLKDLHPDEYEKLDYCSSALPKPADNPYVYRANMTPLLGRDDELNQLIEFAISTEDDFRWWALTGPGGSGKSKLAMELMKHVSTQPGWICDTLTDFSDLKGYFDKCTRSTLVVVDYVQAHARELGSQMETLSKEIRTHPLRLLLVERNDPTGGFSWTEQLYENVHHKADLRSRCWERQFLELHSLKDESLVEIIRCFSENLRQQGVSNHAAPTDKDCEALLERLKAIDKDLHRPLYTMFLTGAWMQGEDPEHWSQEQVLDYIIERECTLLDERLRQLTGSTMKNRFRACLALYRFATAGLGPELNEILPHFPERKWNYIKQAAEDAGLDGPEELLEQMSLLRDGKLVPMEPDLMGEYFVYHWLVDEAKEGQRRDFLKASWVDSLSAAVFFDRLFFDYAYLLNQKPDQWGLLPPLRLLVTDLSEGVSLMYAVLCTNATGCCTDSDQCRRFADQIEEVQQQFQQDREIALELAKGLVNLASEQDETGASATIDRLEELSRQWQEDREIALVLAKGLVNLSAVQNEGKASSTVDWLEGLSKQWQEDREIALELAKGLVNLSAKQDEAGASATIDRLEELAKQWPKNQEIALELAKGLVNLASEQDEAGANITIAGLEELSRQWQEYREIALVLAKGLVNLSAVQNEGKASYTVDWLEGLSKQWQEDREIALELAKGLVNLSAKQDEAGASATIDRLEELAKQWPKNQEIALELAKGLVNLVSEQDEAGANTTIAGLEELSRQWQENRKIALELAKGLVITPAIK